MQEDNQFQNWECFFGSMEGCMSVDFSRCGISSIPDEILGRFVNIQYLYLEGNRLTELSSAFFPTLRELRWLDLRNNKLKVIPNTILDHPSLQVFLLEGNDLETIPVEIGSVETLRGLQLARNPIKYPPQSIINQGVQSTIAFLRKQWQQLQSPQQIHLISETHSSTKSASAQSRNGGKRKVVGCKSAVALKSTREEQACNLSNTLSGLSAANLNKCISVQPISRRGLQTETVRPRDEDQVLFVDNRLANFDRRSRNFTKKKDPNGPLRHDQIMGTGDMKEKLLRDIWIEKVREMLLKQEAIIQRRKNTEALEQWHDETKMIQQAQSKKGATNAELNFPYDTDPEFLKMLSRKDLKKDWHKQRESSLHNIRHEEPINNKILSIMAAIQELQTGQSATSASPRSEQMILSQEIKKIREIQRSLNSLKLKNFGQLGYSSK